MESSQRLSRDAARASAMSCFFVRGFCFDAANAHSFPGAMWAGVPALRATCVLAGQADGLTQKEPRAGPGDADIHHAAEDVAVVVEVDERVAAGAAGPAALGRALH